MKWLRVLLCCLPLPGLVSCIYRETMPQVRLKPNDSGLVCSAFVYNPPHDYGAESLRIGFHTGKPLPPSVPSGVWAHVQRTNAVRPQSERPYITVPDGRLSVLSVEHMEIYTSWYAKNRRELNLWREVLQTGDTTAVRQGAGTDEIPWISEQRLIYGKVRIVQFPWGRAVLFLTHYGGFSGPVNNEMLTLTVQGLTSDGRYAVHGHFDIRHLRLPDTVDDDRAPGRRILNITYRGGEEKAEAWLDRQADEDFVPRIQQYIALLAALDIRRGPSVWTPRPPRDKWDF